MKFWSSLVWSETEKGPEVDLYLSTLLLNCFGDKTLKWTAHPKTLGLKRFGTNLINEEDTKRKNQQKKTTICSELHDKREYTENCNEESDSCIHEVKLVKSKKALSRGTKKAGRGSFSFTNHWPIIFLLMLNTYCTSVELISFFMSALF